MSADARRYATEFDHLRDRGVRDQTRAVRRGRFDDMHMPTVLSPARGAPPRLSVPVPVSAAIARRALNENVGLRVVPRNTTLRATGCSPSATAVPSQALFRMADRNIIMRPMEEGPRPDSSTGRHRGPRGSGIRKERARRFKEAFDSVWAEADGLPPEVVEERLVSAFRSHDVFVPRQYLPFLARSMSHPPAVWKHPIRWRREARRLRSPEDPESPLLQAASDELDRRLWEIEGVVGTRTRRTIDGIVHEVTIHPWSDQLAERVREVASPNAVEISPRTDSH